MARIILEPGERFEHSHADRSFSALESGEAEIVHEGRAELLTVGSPVTTPPNISHTLVNVGRMAAVVNCVHPSEIDEEMNLTTEVNDDR
jgi:quercetin dioxygenase-like cupin family protein